MGHKIRTLLVAIALSILLIRDPIPSGKALAETSESAPTVSILVFNYSEASPVLLAQAERETTRIFARSGIHFEWTPCPPHPSASSPAACEAEIAAGEVRVRVLARRLNYVFQDSVFGFATQPTFATTYYESAQHLAQTSTDSESSLSIILGHLIAHEIGHLLLGKNQHTAAGIMMARWDILQIQQALRGGLGFSHEQAKRMRMNAFIRMRPSPADGPAS